MTGETETAATLLRERAVSRRHARRQPGHAGPAGRGRPSAGIGPPRPGLSRARRQPADRGPGASEASGNRRDLSWATGLRGELYALGGRDEEALGLYRQAALDAEQAGAPELLFRWQWLSGRILAAQGQQDAAITAYRSAVRNLELVRLDLPAFDARTGRSLFRETLGPVFTELADLLLQQAGASQGDVQQVDLGEARAIIEELKTVELEDYFKDDCAADLTSRVQTVDRPGDRTAVLYPVLLADRTELILSLPDGRLVASRSGASGPEITEAAQRFRLAIDVPPDPANPLGWLPLAVWLDTS